MRILIIIGFLSSTLYADDRLLKSLGLNEHKSGPLESTPVPASQACATPYLALKAFFHGNKENKVACFATTTFAKNELITVAHRLASVLRNHNIRVNLSDVPNKEDYEDPRTKIARYTLSQILPSIYLQKSAEGWIFPDGVLETANKLYKTTLNFDITPLYKVLPQWATENIFGIEGTNLVQLTLLLLLVVIGLIIRIIVLWLASWHLSKALHRIPVDQAVFKKIGASIGTLAMAGFFALFIPELNFSVTIIHYLEIAIRLLAAISAVVLLYHGVDIFASILRGRAEKSKRKLDKQIAPLVGRALKIVICVIGGIFVLQNLDINVTSLLAGVTIGGLAFSFAAKDAVANLFGSVTIFTDKSFTVGDWIKVGTVEGKVETVGFRSTRIRTAYNTLVIMPNSKFTDSSVENYTLRKTRRISTEINITYDTPPAQIEAFCNGIRAIVSAHPLAHKDSYEVHLNEYGESSLKILLQFFTIAETSSLEFRMRHEIFIEILLLAKSLGIKFGFPTRYVYAVPVEILR